MKIIRNNIAFLLPYFLFLLVAGTFLLLQSKGSAHLFLNKYHLSSLDYLISIVTHIGDGLFAIAIIGVLFFVKYRYAFFVGLSNILASLTTQTLKHTIFSDQVRPKKYFEGIAELNLIPWVENYSFNSFPSGHTTTAFATFFCLSLITENKMLKLFCFFLALTIGLTRVYLSQHFLNDVYAGSIIGTCFAFFSYLLFFEFTKFKEKNWLEKSLLNRS